MRILALDPSINNVGWCLFDDTKPKKWQWGTWHLDGSNMILRLHDLVGRIQMDEYIKGKFDILVTEYPTFFSSEKGQIAAHQSYTVDLACICGFVAGWYGMQHRNWHMCTASDWKGMVKKEVTFRKMMKLFHPSTFHSITLSEHAVDAIMICRWWLVEYGWAAYQKANQEYPQLPELRI